MYCEWVRVYMYCSFSLMFIACDWCWVVLEWRVISTSCNFFHSCISKHRISSIFDLSPVPSFCTIGLTTQSRIKNEYSKSRSGCYRAQRHNYLERQVFSHIFASRQIRSDSRKTLPKNYGKFPDVQSLDYRSNAEQASMCSDRNSWCIRTCHNFRQRLILRHWSKENVDTILLTPKILRIVFGVKQLDRDHCSQEYSHSWAFTWNWSRAASFLSSPVSMFECYGIELICSLLIRT